ncbi:hypothetical protein BDZ97DRAFT_1752318 [Flammula alnicola]|nr:hypothetical protein BDZ97DRAFT_1752318 [Flammula alnicola]
MSIRRIWVKQVATLFGMLAWKYTLRTIDLHFCQSTPDIGQIDRGGIFQIMMDTNNTDIDCSDVQHLSEAGRGLVVGQLTEVPDPGIALEEEFLCINICLIESILMSLAGAQIDRMKGDEIDLMRADDSDPYVEGETIETNHNPQGWSDTVTEALGHHKWCQIWNAEAMWFL